MFENFDGTEIPVKNLVTVGTPAGSGNAAGADQIWIWNTDSASWTKYFYYSGRNGDKWIKTTDTTSATETADTLAPGKTFFFCRASTAKDTTTLTISGKVVSLKEGSSNFACSAGQLAFASNPWPIDMAVSDINNYYTSGIPVGSGNAAGADQIWIWNTDSASWTKYFYYSGRNGDKWIKTTDATSATETTDVIPAGVGFFFQRASTATSPATITFTQK